MADSTHLNLPYIDANQAQKHVTHNEAVRLLDASVQMAVISRTLTAPPGSPADGDRYIVASGATGAWAGWDLNIAYYVDGAWMKLVPQAGWQSWIEDESLAVVWNGTAWNADGDVTGPASSTSNAIARYSGTGGKTIKNSSILANNDGSLAVALLTSLAAASSGKVQVGGLDIAGRGLAASRGQYGATAALQPLLACRKLAYWNPPGNAATVPGVFGIAAPTALGTATARNVAATNLPTRMRRLGYVSAATAGSLAGHYSATAQFTIGDGAGLGGFLYVVRFGVSDAAAVSGARMFVGLRSAVGAPTNVEPNTLTDCVGLAQLSTSNNLHIVYGGSAAQAAIDLGASFPANTLSADAYELALYAPPESQVIGYRVTRLNMGDVATGTLSGTVGTVIPAGTTFLAHTAWRCNNATALSVGIDMVSIYMETDN